MPYFSIEDLPDPIQNNLPKRAQEIYRKAFNKTWDSHRDPETLPKDVSRVELSARVAWTAVKEEYEKKNDKWVKIKKKKKS